MSHFSTGPRLPGTTAGDTWTPREIIKNGLGEYMAGTFVIDGTKARDPGNSPVDILRNGMVLGKITSGGKLAPSAIGVIKTTALTGAATEVVLNAAICTELARRVGATGTFKITGPPTAGGVVRTLTATYSALTASSGTRATITPLGVSDVWTLTAPAGQDAGMYQLEVTTGKGTSAEVVAVTAALAANANTATVDAALEALANVGVGGVAAVYADPTLTITFASNLGPVHVRVLADTTNDGGVFEGGWAAVHTTTGVDGRFVVGSWIQPTDGSETPVTILNEESAGCIKVTDENGSDIVVPFTMLIGGVIDYSQIIDAPSDTSLRTWLVDALNARGRFVFDDKYIATA